MKYLGENAVKKLISLIKGDLATKQPTITASGLLKGEGSGTVTAADTQEATLVDVPNGLLKGDGTTISAAVAGTDYATPTTVETAIGNSKEIFWVHASPNGFLPGTSLSPDKTPNEVMTALKAGKIVKFELDTNSIYGKVVLSITDWIEDDSVYFLGMDPTNRIFSINIDTKNEALTWSKLQGVTKVDSYFKLKTVPTVPTDEEEDYILMSLAGDNAYEWMPASSYFITDTAIPDATITSTWNSVTV